MALIYLIPSFIADDAVDTIPPYVIEAVKNCSVIFAENERTARRFLKAMDRQVVIDHFEWFAIHKAEQEQLDNFRKKIKEDKNIAIISEAGCPGVADPGQILVELAQQMNCTIKPLVGPSSILLALMASGMNGQQFEFMGYLPVDSNERAKKIKELESDSRKQNCTKIFIETPYRNDQLMAALLQHCNGNTKICVAADITSLMEFIKTKTVADWKKEKTGLHKRPVIFLLHAAG
ncbi:MAG: SAM-dependent methyltransferase [Ferruginibacter sp.]